MLLLLGSAIAACGDDGADPDVGSGTDATVAGDDGGEGDGGGDSGALDAETATLRMVNLVGVEDGGIDVDVVGTGADITSDHVYATVAYGEVAELEFPVDWDARVVRTGTDEEVAASHTVHSDTEPGRVVVFRDTGTYSGADNLGAFPEDRKDGLSIVGMASAIVDDDPNRTWRFSTEDGVCLFSLGNEVPAPMATAADGGETGGILTVQLVDDFVWYVEPGAQTLSFADSAADVFEQGDDCSSHAFDVDIEPEEGKAVFVALYGTSDDVRSTVYYED
jgi:hypothetical protein